MPYYSKNIYSNPTYYTIADNESPFTYIDGASNQQQHYEKNASEQTESQFDKEQLPFNIDDLVPPNQLVLQKQYQQQQYQQQQQQQQYQQQQYQQQPINVMQNNGNTDSMEALSSHNLVLQNLVNSSSAYNPQGSFTTWNNPRQIQQEIPCNPEIHLMHYCEQICLRYKLLISSIFFYFCLVHNVSNEMQFDVNDGFNQITCSIDTLIQNNVILQEACKGLSLKQIYQVVFNYLLDSRFKEGQCHNTISSEAATVNSYQTLNSLLSPSPSEESQLHSGTMVHWRGVTENNDFGVSSLIVSDNEAGVNSSTDEPLVSRFYLPTKCKPFNPDTSDFPLKKDEPKWKCMVKGCHTTYSRRRDLWSKHIYTNHFGYGTIFYTCSIDPNHRGVQQTTHREETYQNHLKNCWKKWKDQHHKAYANMIEPPEHLYFVTRPVVETFCCGFKGCSYRASTEKELKEHVFNRHDHYMLKVVIYVSCFPMLLVYKFALSRVARLNEHLRFASGHFLVVVARDNLLNLKWHASHQIAAVLKTI
ncbi:hypothetical protein BDC45DRAFT_535774 [Circinella umbellata]|nr:hypothetical protein BDC45DRAFT_535774 [Circinella umbellata]